MDNSTYKSRPATARFDTEECALLLDAVEVWINKLYTDINLADPEDLALWTKWHKIQQRLRKRIANESKED